MHKLGHQAVVSNWFTGLKDSVHVPEADSNVKQAAQQVAIDEPKIDDEGKPNTNASLKTIFISVCLSVCLFVCLSVCLYVTRIT